VSGRGSQKQATRLGIPEGFNVLTAFPFKGVNQSASRIAMDDAEFNWLENFVRVGDGNLRAAYDAATPFFTKPAGTETIIYFFWYNIGPQTYVAVFYSDGTAQQVSYPQGVVTQISSTNGLFYNTAISNNLPACVQSGTQYLLISNNNTQNDYWIWDGSILYGAGSIAPIDADDITDGGSGYTSVPSYFVFGGSGSGVNLTPIINDGSVIGLTVNNPGSGYLPGETVQVGFTGGGSDTSAELFASITAGALQFITLVDGGSGYSGGPYAATISGGGGTGATAVYAINATTGQVSGITLTNGGSGYVTTPSVSFPSGGGSGAEAVASLTGSSIEAISIVNGGSGFTGTPTLDIVGGGGTGAQAVAVVTNGVITSVTITNAGSGYTTLPGVIVETGVNNAAAATLELMPFGISGTSIETYQSRVWICFPHQLTPVSTGGTFNVSAPDSLTDFATSDGGDIFTNTDRFLRQQYTFMRQTSNFLYAAGDSSVSVISNVQTGGNPTSTTFSYQNTDPQIGSSWRDSAQDFSNTIVFANAFGVYGLYGGSVRKVSTKIDNIFTNAVLPADNGLTPTSAVVNLYSQKLYLLLMTITDPFTFQPRRVLLGWDQQNWYIYSQTPNLRMIGTQEINSDLQAWGTDGNSLYQLFATPSTIPKVISTKQWGGAQSFLINMTHSIYIDAVDMSAAQAGLIFSGSVDGVGIAVPAVNSVTSTLASAPSGSYPIAANLGFVAPKAYGAVYGAGVGAGLPQVPGSALGLTLASSSEDFVLRNLSLGVIEMTAVA
jgi:hypothetical protein